MTPTERSVRALAEAVIPSSGEDATAGAGDVAAERFVLHYLEFVMPGLGDLLAAALDGVAAGRLGVPFEAGLFETLEPQQRLAALRALGEHEVPELRELTDLAITLVTAAFYGEWTGQDAGGRMVARPVGWELTGYEGPLDAVPTLLA